ncbi:MAG: sugar phosphate isomerase/epimerase [Clostridiales bacterium]|nr:sugar phosphate isomerase/epimerase [Clostridiales bacterium]
MAFKIGIIVDSFRLPVREGIKKAAQLGAKGIQIYATRGEMAPSALSTRQRFELLDYIKSNGLVVSALCGDPGGGGFSHPDNNPARIELSKRIIDLAVDLDTKVVTTHVGVIPYDKNHDRYKIIYDACAELGEYADNAGISFAIETGPEPSTVLRAFIEDLPCTGIKVNFDPANLAMVIGEKAEVAVANLAPYIIHTHAKDGRMIEKCNPEDLYVYHTKSWAGAFLETPLGEGDVNFPAYLKVLAESGFDGFLTIEREVGDNPVADIKKAVDFLKKLI